MRPGSPPPAMFGRPPWAVLTVASLLLVIILGACGTASPSGPTKTTPTTRPPTTSTTSNLDGPDVDKLPPVPGPSATPSNPDLSSATAQATFLKGVFNDIQEMWKSDFADGGISYSPSQIVIFQSSVNTACG